MRSDPRLATRREIIRLYEEEHLLPKEIAEALHLNSATVLGNLKTGGAIGPDKPYRIRDEIIHELRGELLLNSFEIGRQLGLGKKVVDANLERCGYEVDYRKFIGRRVGEKVFVAKQKKAYHANRRCPRLTNARWVFQRPLGAMQAWGVKSCDTCVLED